MRTPVLVSLLLLILLAKAQGIRLQPRFISEVHKTSHEEEKSKLIEVQAADHSVSKGALPCKDNHSSVRNRNLMTKAASSTTTITTTSKTSKTGESKPNPTMKPHSAHHVPNGNNENFTVTSPKVSEHPKADSQKYPDILDIAGMDYSPAKRKPPIHN